MLIAIQAYLKKIENSQIQPYLTFERTRGITIKSEVNSKKEIINIRVEFNDIETKKNKQNPKDH